MKLPVNPKKKGETEIDDNKSQADDELFDEIFNLCEEAFASGVDSVDIYKVLHSKKLLEQSTTKKRIKRKRSRSSIFTTCFLNYLNFSRYFCSNSNRGESFDDDDASSGSGGTIWSKIGDCFQFVVRTLAVFFMLISILIKTCICVFGLVLFSLWACHYVFKFDVNPLIYFPSWAERQCLLPAHPIILEMVRPIEDCSVCQNFQKTNSVTIEFASPPTKEEFLSVAYTSRPIVVRGAAFGNGMPDNFSFVSLKNVFESEPGGVESVSEECQFLPFRSPFTSLSEAFEEISDSATWEKPWYIGWSNCHPGVASKLREMFPRPEFLPADSESSAIDWFFIGSPGLGASMHIDYVRRPSWQAQLSGIKKWILKPPPECDDDCSHDISFVIYPGDMVFVDTNVWFHETRIEGDQLSISIGSEYD